MAEEKKSRSEQKREAIIEAAKVAFKEMGVQGCSMDKLAELAQVSKRTLYNHFKTKENLVVHIFQEMWQRTMTSIEFQYDPQSPVEEQLKHLLKEEVDLIGSEEYVQLNRIALAHFLYHPDDLQNVVTSLEDQEKTLDSWLQAAIDDGRLAVDNFDAAVEQIHGLLKGACFWPQVACLQPVLTEEEKQTLTERTVAMFMNTYNTNR